MRTSFVALAADASSDAVAAALGGGKTERQRQRLFPVVDAGRHLVGVVTRSGLRQWLNAADGTPRHLRDVIEHQPVVAYEDEPLRVIVFRMAETGLTRLPVIARRDGTLVGMLALTDLLIARARILEAEQRRERVLGGRLRLFDMFGRGRAA